MLGYMTEECNPNPSQLLSFRSNGGKRCAKVIIESRSCWTSIITSRWHISELGISPALQRRATYAISRLSARKIYRHIFGSGLLKREDYELHQIHRERFATIGKEPIVSKSIQGKLKCLTTYCVDFNELGKESKHR